MTIAIRINTDNAAFADNRDDEVGRILREWLQRHELGRPIFAAGSSRRLYDCNGNWVGTVTVRGK